EFHGQAASVIEMEHVRRRVSKFRGRRATIDGGEEVQGPRSHFHVQRGSLIDMEQIRARASKFRGRRATFDGGEQVQGPRSNFRWWRASSGAEKQLSRSEEHTSELQSRFDLVCRLLLEKKK